MHIISKPNVGCFGNALSLLSRMMGRTGLLVCIGFLALLHNPGQARGVIASGQYGAALIWNPSSSPGVVGYRFYYGTASGNYTSSVVLGNVTTNAVSSLTSGVTYFFAVTAYDTNGLESGFSNESSFVPGVPTVQIRTTPTRQFALTMSGLIGRNYDVQATQDFKTWTVVGTVTMGSGGSANFTDTNAASFSRRFYRTQVKP